nr:hypothetical protein [Paenibacillus ginsengarvi]
MRFDQIAHVVLQLGAVRQFEIIAVGLIQNIDLLALRHQVGERAALFALDVGDFVVGKLGADPVSDIFIEAVQVASCVRVEDELDGLAAFVLSRAVRGGGRRWFRFSPRTSRHQNHSCGETGEPDHAAVLFEHVGAPPFLNFAAEPIAFHLQRPTPNVSDCRSSASLHSLRTVHTDAIP